MSLEQNISKGIMEAMKAKDTVRLTTLRNIKKYLIEAKTATGGIDELADAEVVKIISKLAKQGSDSAALYTRQGAGTWPPRSWRRWPSCRSSCPGSSPPGNSRRP